MVLRVVVDARIGSAAAPCAALARPPHSRPLRAWRADRRRRACIVWSSGVRAEDALLDALLAAVTGRQTAAVDQLTDGLGSGLSTLQRMVQPRPPAFPPGTTCSRVGGAGDTHSDGATTWAALVRLACGGGGTGHTTYILDL
jgi:hypothetical protein